ncbi:unnamed protein product [Rotaria sordida]|uniref:Uncharacterized protein n=1 Tax=Rotaria sordida TaxID=392033 RepID=A0A819RH65_9BILA|nr:unnamed protein product [Rotaria sordida]
MHDKSNSNPDGKKPSRTFYGGHLITMNPKIESLKEWLTSNYSEHADRILNANSSDEDIDEACAPVFEAEWLKLTRIVRDAAYKQNYKWNDNLLRRTVQGLVSVLLSLRKKSVTIRYQKLSNMTRILADKLSSTLKRQVDFTPSNPNDINQTIVLIIDR